MGVNTLFDLRPFVDDGHILTQPSLDRGPSRSAAV